MRRVELTVILALCLIADALSITPDCRAFEVTVMSDCCSTSFSTPSFPKKHSCPGNGKEYGQVSVRTIKHHIQAPWSWALKDQGYYFCSDPNCDVVYFGQDNSIITKSSVRTEVGVKERSENSLVCYCYGVTRAEAEDNPRVRDFVVEETKRKNCACESRNPSGKCCLADFPRHAGSADKP